MNFGARMFKYPSLIGMSPLPLLSPTENITHVNIIYLFTSGSLGSIEPWVVPCHEDVELSGASMSVIVVDIVDP